VSVTVKWARRQPRPWEECSGGPAQAGMSFLPARPTVSLVRALPEIPPGKASSKKKQTCRWAAGQLGSPILLAPLRHEVHRCRRGSWNRRSRPLRPSTAPRRLERCCGRRPTLPAFPARIKFLVENLSRFREGQPLFALSIRRPSCTKGLGFSLLALDAHQAKQHRVGERLRLRAAAPRVYPFASCGCHSESARWRRPCRPDLEARSSLRTLVAAASASSPRCGPVLNASLPKQRGGGQLQSPACSLNVFDASRTGQNRCGAGRPR